MAKAVAKTYTSNPGLGEVGALFSDSWDLFKKSWTKQLVLMLIIGLVSFALFLVGVVAFMMFNAPQIPAIMSAMQNNGAGMESVLPSILGSGAFVLLVLGIVFWLIGSAYTAGLLYVVQAADKNQTVSYSDALKMGVRKAWPMLVTGIVMGLLVIGGYWLFIIPGLVMAFYFSYSVFEIILGNQSPMNSLRQSIRIVGTNFWGVLGRMMLLVLIYWAVSFVWQLMSGSLVRMEMGGVLLIGSLLYTVLQYALQFFAVAYSYTLYMRAKSAANGAKPGSLKKAAIISAVGWVIGILFWTAFSAAMVKYAPVFERAIQQAEEQRGNSMDPYRLMNDETSPYGSDDVQTTDDTYMMDDANVDVDVDVTNMYKVVPTATPTMYRR